MYVFNQSRRLNKPDDFKRLFQRGARLKSTHLISYHDLNALSNARLGVIVPKKVVKSSVQRHQLKRIVRESFRLNQYFLNHHDVVILFIKARADAAVIRSELSTLWLKMNQKYQRS